MNQCKAQYKRERESQRKWIKRKQKICFEVQAPSSTSPPSHRRISTNSSTQNFPRREPPLRILGKYNLEVHNSSLKYNLSLEARHNTNHLYTQRDRHLAKQRLTSHQRDTKKLNHLYTQRDNHNPMHNLLYTQREGTKPSKDKGLQQLVISKTTNQFFLTKQDPNRQDRYDKLKCEKIKCFEQRKSLGKISKQIQKFRSKTNSQKTLFSLKFQHFKNK